MIIDYKNAEISIDDHRILKNINLEVNENDFVFLTGKVGSGKTSLLRTLYGVLPVKGERAEVLGFGMQTLKRKKLQELRRMLGTIFQNFQLLPDRTVYANLEFVLKATGWKKKADITRRIAEVLQQVDMSDKADHYPHELSGGEQQRVSIARALAKNPKILLCDEPTGALDSETGVVVLKLLLKMARNYGKTIIIVTHNQNIAKMADEVVRVKNGKIKSVEMQENPLDADEVDW